MIDEEVSRYVRRGKRRPSTLEEYLSWANDVLQVRHDEATNRWYTANATAALNAAQANPFFAGTDTLLQTTSKEYEGRYRTDLLMPKPLDLHIKPYNSILQKSFRFDVLKNDKFPDPPDKGWLTPDQWFERLNDVVRGTLVAKYIDGPTFLLKRFHDKASALRLEARSAAPYSDDGYYAHHFYVKIPVDITTPAWEGKLVLMDVEVQVTTQLQEVMRTLTHHFYSQEREREQRRKENWKWDYSSDKFKASYLGHTLHMLEGIIVELRDRNLNPASDQSSREDSDERAS